ncbi:MAG: PIG-L family deacetylase [Pseudomonadales bacterium]|nr:PIG-L family deacetylase [Pseudomonadales bacterium]
MGVHSRLADAVLVVAHPDDEILWFSSLVRRVSKVVICYLATPGDEACTDARRAVEAVFPLENAVFLGLTESMGFLAADWRYPQASPSGLVLGGTGERPVLPAFNPDLYRQNAITLHERLRDLLQEAPVVITHNPWGEYGHEEHVQVHRVVTALGEECGFEVWFDNYASDRSAALMARTLAGRKLLYESAPTSPESVADIEALYRRLGCWTWPFDDYRWFENECMARFAPGEGAGSVPGATFPVNFINVDNAVWQRPRLPPPSLLLRCARRVRRLVLGD